MDYENPPLISQSGTKPPLTLMPEGRTRFVLQGDDSNSRRTDLPPSDQQQAVVQVGQSLVQAGNHASR